MSRRRSDSDPGSPDARQKRAAYRERTGDTSLYRTPPTSPTPSSPSTPGEGGFGAAGGGGEGGGAVAPRTAMRPARPKDSDLPPQRRRSISADARLKRERHVTFSPRSTEKRLRVLPSAPPAARPMDPLSPSETEVATKTNDGNAMPFADGHKVIDIVNSLIDGQLKTRAAFNTLFTHFERVHADQAARHTREFLLQHLIPQHKYGKVKYSTLLDIITIYYNEYRGFDLSTAIGYAESYLHHQDIIRPRSLFLYPV